LYVIFWVGVLTQVLGVFWHVAADWPAFNEKDVGYGIVQVVAATAWHVKQVILAAAHPLYATSRLAYPQAQRNANPRWPNHWVGLAMRQSVGMTDFQSLAGHSLKA
jgi:hypothetical protein